MTEDFISSTLFGVMGPFRDVPPVGSLGAKLPVSGDTGKGLTVNVESFHTVGRARDAARVTAKMERRRPSGAASRIEELFKSTRLTRV